MDPHADDSDIFAIPNFWQTSKLLPELMPEASKGLEFFAKNVTESSPLNTGLSSFALDTTTPEQDGFFKLPIHDLPSTAANDEAPDASPDAIVESGESISDIETNDETDDNSELWLDPKIPPQPEPLYHSWDAFVNEKSTTAYQPMLISEAGPAVYDALLSWSKDPLKLQNVAVPVVDTKTYMSSLLALALASESVLYSKVKGKHTFQPALPRMRVSGFSSDVLKWLEIRCKRCGNTLLNLRLWAQSAYSEHPSRCGVALASTISQVLQVIQEWVALQGRNPRSLLQLQSTVSAIEAILRPFKAFTASLRAELEKKGKTHMSDEDVLNVAFHQAYTVDNNEEYLRQIMREVLRRVSVPWIEFLEEWLGTRREEGLPFTKENIGASKGFVVVEAKVSIDDFGRETKEVDFALAPEKMPTFMPADVVDTIFETGRNLRFIRSFHPEHPLSQQDVINSGLPPKAEWLYDWDAILRLEGRVTEYRDNLIAAVQSSRAGPFRNASTANSKLSEDNTAFSFTFFGLDESKMEERILASIDQFAQPVAIQTEDVLSRILRDRLSGTHKSAIEHSHSTPHWTLLPVLSFGGIASAQAQVVNKEILRLLFTAHDLRGHLTLLRDFQLLGNGIFCSSLSHALFDPDLTSAERHAGGTLEGSAMGLRLGGRENWPPASSELRLALMGILTDCYAMNRVSRAQHSSTKESSELPGDMSFAIRDLSSEEIDKCMDPHSLEALDFLRLSYTAPPPLSPIITSISLMQYDRIFKLLLRVLRLLFVVGQLFRDIRRTARRWKDPGDASYRFVREANHFVSSISAYFMETGVAVPWHMFEKGLDRIQADLDRPSTKSSEIQIQSPDSLREFHSLVLDRIMQALFLRKRQQPVLKLLEEIFNIILRFAKYIRLQSLGSEVAATEECDPSTMYLEYKKKIQVFITVCRSLTEKARQTNNRKAEDRAFRDQYGTGDESMIAQLLVKLDIGDYYLNR